MSSLTADRASPDTTVHGLFKNAIAAIDQRLDRHRPEQFTDSTSALQESARCLADAFLVARGCGMVSDAERVELLARQPIIDRETDDPLIELLRFEPRDEWSERQAHKLNALEQQYRALLPRYRAKLVDEAPGYKRVSEIFRAAANKAWVRGTIAGLAAAGMLSVAAYQWADPAYQLTLEGQVFWKHAPEEPFSEKQSRTFPVNVDGKRRDYVIRFPDPISITALRLDPVDNVHATEVEIQGIRLFDTDGNVDKVYDNLASWACTNCRWLSRSERRVRLKPNNDDPFITAPPVDPVTISRIRVTMSAAAKKTFWEWITQPEKRTD